MHAQAISRVLSLNISSSLLKSRGVPLVATTVILTSMAAATNATMAAATNAMIFVMVIVAMIKEKRIMIHNSKANKEGGAYQLARLLECLLNANVMWHWKMNGVNTCQTALEGNAE